MHTSAALGMIAGKMNKPLEVPKWFTTEEPRLKIYAPELDKRCKKTFLHIAQHKSGVNVEQSR